MENSKGRLRLGKLYQEYLFLDLFEYSFSCKSHLYKHLWTCSQTARRYLLKFAKTLKRRFKVYKSADAYLSSGAQVMPLLIDTQTYYKLRVFTPRMGTFNKFCEAIKGLNHIKVKSVHFQNPKQQFLKEDIDQNGELFKRNIVNLKVKSFEIRSLNDPHLMIKLNLNQWEGLIAFRNFGIVDKFTEGHNLKQGISSFNNVIYHLTYEYYNDFRFLVSIAKQIKRLKVMNSKSSFTIYFLIKKLIQTDLERLTIHQACFNFNKFLQICKEISFYPQSLKFTSLKIRQWNVNFDLLDEYMSKVNFITGKTKQTLILSINSYKHLDKIQRFLDQVDKVTIQNEHYSTSEDVDPTHFNIMMKDLKPNINSRLKELALFTKRGSHMKLILYYFLLICPNLETLRLHYISQELIQQTNYPLAPLSLPKLKTLEVTHCFHVICEFLNQIFKEISNNVEALILKIVFADHEYQVGIKLLQQPLPNLKKLSLMKLQFGNQKHFTDVFNTHKLKKLTFDFQHIHKLEFLGYKQYSINKIQFNWFNFADWMLEFFKEFKGFTFNITNSEITLDDLMKLKQQNCQHQIKARNIKIKGSIEQELLKKNSQLHRFSKVQMISLT